MTEDVLVGPEERAQARPYIAELASTLGLRPGPELREAEPGSCDECGQVGERLAYGRFELCSACSRRRFRVAIGVAEDGLPPTYGLRLEDLEPLTYVAVVGWQLEPRDLELYLATYVDSADEQIRLSELAADLRREAEAERLRREHAVETLTSALPSPERAGPST